MLQPFVEQFVVGSEFNWFVQHNWNKYSLKFDSSASTANVLSFRYLDKTKKSNGGRFVSNTYREALSRLVINLKSSFDILPPKLVLVLCEEGQRCLEIYKVFCFAFEQLNDQNKAPIYDPNASSAIKVFPACSLSAEQNFPAFSSSINSLFYPTLLNF